MATARVIAKICHAPLREKEEKREIELFRKQLQLFRRKSYRSRPYHFVSKEFVAGMQRVCDECHFKLTIIVDGITTTFDIVPLEP